MGGGGGGFTRPKASPTFHFTMSVLENVYRPRSLFLGLTLGFATVSILKSQLAEPYDNEKHTGISNQVEAWKNPKTGLWEQPAPWDPFYRKLKPQLVMVPREHVRPSGR